MIQSGDLEEWVEWILKDLQRKKAPHEADPYTEWRNSRRNQSISEHPIHPCQFSSVHFLRQFWVLANSSRSLKTIKEKMKFDY